MHAMPTNPVSTPIDDPTRSLLRANVEEVRARIAAAARRAGREPSSVTLVAATKYVGPAVVRTLAGLGVRDLGENRVADAEEKSLGVEGVRWHLIGHLQRNKARRAAALFDAIHSVDSAALAVALSRHATGRPTPLPVLIEVNLAGEATKSGVRGPADARALAEEIRRLPGLALVGLMAMPPQKEDPEGSRGYFRTLAALLPGLGGPDSGLVHLSMGMSQDFEVAIEEGATLVRVGSALFRGLDG